jgi:hypothetical protein
MSSFITRAVTTATPFLQRFLDELPAVRTLVGFSATDATYVNAADANALQYTINGGVVISTTANGVPYATFNGTTGYLSVATNTTVEVANELTLLLAFYPTSLAAAAYVMAKESGAPNRSYGLYFDATTGTVGFTISADGTTNQTHGSTAAVVVNTWNFVAARFTPSTEMALFVNGTKSHLVAAVPASIYAGAAELAIGARSTGLTPLPGNIAVAAVCSGLISDDHLALLRAHCQAWGVAA